MSTSGSIDFSMNARAIGTFALKLLNITPTTQSPSANDLADAVQALNMMLKTWQMSGPNLFRHTEGTVTLVADTASYVLSPKPFRVGEARYRDSSSRDIPMWDLTRQEYTDLPMKTTTGVPTNYFVDYQRSAATMYVWPVPSSVSTETIKYTYQRAIEDIDSPDNDIDIPQEWFETVAYNLADRLCEQYNIQGGAGDRVTRRAAQLLGIAKDSDREDVVRFVPERHG